MMKNLFTGLRRLAVYGLILVFGLPLSVLLSGAKSAHASAAKIAPAPKVQKIAFLGPPTGLHRANTYVAGQIIRMEIATSGSVEAVWAEVGELDDGFPSKLDFENISDGKWGLMTPRLSENLQTGSHSVKLIAEGSDGKTIQTKVKITLQKFSPIVISSYKVTGGNLAIINWQPVSWSDKYLVSWGLMDASTQKTLTTKANSLTLKELEPGSFYNVSVQPLRGEAVGPATKIGFMTLGSPSPKVVAGEATVKESLPKPIAPQITPEAATSKRIAQTSPAPVAPTVTPITPSPSVSPSPSPSPSPEQSQTGGWSKLLIALSILVIAAAAAIGGYYGYEWLLLRDRDKEPPTSKSGGRW